MHRGEVTVKIGLVGRRREGGLSGAATGTIHTIGQEDRRIGKQVSK